MKEHRLLSFGEVQRPAEAVPSSEKNESVFSDTSPGTNKELAERKQKRDVEEQKQRGNPDTDLQRRLEAMSREEIMTSLSKALKDDVEVDVGTGERVSVADIVSNQFGAFKKHRAALEQHLNNALPQEWKNRVQVRVDESDRGGTPIEIQTIPQEVASTRRGWDGELSEKFTQWQVQGKGMSQGEQRTALLDALSKALKDDVEVNVGTREWVSVADIVSNQFGAFKRHRAALEQHLNNALPQEWKNRVQVRVDESHRGGTPIEIQTIPQEVASTRRGWDGELSEKFTQWYSEK